MSGPRTLLELVERVAARGAETFVGHRAATWTAAEFVVRTAAVAEHLAANGVEPGDRVASWLEKGLDDAVAPFAVACAGAVSVVVNPQSRDAQLRHVLGDAAARVCLTSATKRSTLDRPDAVFGDCRPVLVESIDAGFRRDPGRSSPAVAAPPEPSDLATLLYTSGSTGRPRGVAQSHRSLVDGARLVSGYLELGPDDHLLAVLPSSFDYGLNQLLSAAWVGCRITVHSYFTAGDLLRRAIDVGATALAGVPELWLAVVDALEAGVVEPAALARLRLATSSGGRLPERVARCFAERLPWLRFFSMYGLTEAFRSSFVPPEQLGRRVATVGRAMPEVELLIVDRDRGTPSAPGVVGELVHCGACVADGYWRDPVATAERFRPDPRGGGQTCVFSGDLASIDADGYVTLLGRADAQLKVGGYRISPDEITEVVRAVPGVATAAAVGVRRGADDLPELAVAVVASATAAPDLPARVLGACRRALPSFMVPAEVHQLAALPLNANHKLDHAALCRSLQDRTPEQSTVR